MRGIVRGMHEWIQRTHVQKLLQLLFKREYDPPMALIPPHNLAVRHDDENDILSVILEQIKYRGTQSPRKT